MAVKAARYALLFSESLEFTRGGPLLLLAAGLLRLTGSLSPRQSPRLADVNFGGKATIGGRLYLPDWQDQIGP